MRSKYGVKKIGVAGYCFGGKVQYLFSSILLKRSEPLQYVARFLGKTGHDAGASVDVGYTAHPSFMLPEELKAITGPLSIAAAETDDIFPEEKRHETETILKELSVGSLKIPYQMNIYSGVVHGFATRGDPNDRRAKFAKEQAFLQAVQFFDEWLK